MAESEGDLGRHDVPRVRDAVLERHPAHARRGWRRRSWLLPPSSRSVPTSLILVMVLTRLLLEGGRRGHHLEDRARLVDARHDRIDEARRVRRGDRLVVVGVVRRIARLGVDLAGVGVDDDGRDPLCPVGDPGGEQLLLDACNWRPASIVSRTSVPATPAWVTLAVSIIGPAAGVAIGDDDLRACRRASTAMPARRRTDRRRPVDEAEEVRRQSRLRTAAGLRIDPLGLRFERQPEDPASADGAPGSGPPASARGRGRGRRTCPAPRACRAARCWPPRRGRGSSSAP